MKYLIFAAIASLSPIAALAEGPILQCQATREGPRADGKPGYELIDQKTITTTIFQKIQTTPLIGATVKSFIDVNGNYLLVIKDEDLNVSSSSMGSTSNKNINLSLSGQGLSNFVTCDLI